MQYSLKQQLNGRWGIYYDFKLLATIGCHKTGLKILASLQLEKFKAKVQKSPNLEAKTESKEQAA